MRDRVLARTLLVAGAVHALVLCAVPRVEPPRPAPAAAPGELTIYITDLPPVPASADTREGATTEEAAPAAPALVAARTGTAAGSAPPGPVEHDSPAAEVSAPAASTSAEPWSAPLTIPSLDVPTRALGSPSASAAAPPGTASPRSTTGGLREGLAEADRARGMGKAGAILSAAREAAGPDVVWNDGGATIRVTIDGAGRLVGATVIDASRDRDAWEAVARAIAARLATRPLTLPADSRGVVVTLRVDVRTRLPSGASPGAPLSSYSEIGTLGKPSPLTDNGSVGTAFDLADIGARPARVVSARVLDESAPIPPSTGAPPSADR